MTKILPASSINMEVRSLLSLLSVEVHASQLHAITGTPCEVPVPKKVIFNVNGFVLKLILFCLRNYKID